MQDCTILLQGRINDECLQLWIKNYKNSNVVLSIWEDEEIWRYDIPHNWQICLNQYPLVRFWEHSNLDYQIITTLKGLEFVNTKYVIKMRADEYWSNVNKIYNKLILSEDKIVTGSMFFRKWGLYKFHCSDKILAGTTENVKSMFNQTLENIKKNTFDCNVPESQLGLGWVMFNESDFDVSRLNERIDKYTFDFHLAVNTLKKGLDIVLADSKDILSRQFNPHYTNHIDFELIRKTLVKDKDILLSCIDFITNKEKIEPIDDKDFMRKWFEIINIDELKPYIATRNFSEKRVWYRNDFDHEEQMCLTDINLD